MPIDPNTGMWIDNPHEALGGSSFLNSALGMMNSAQGANLYRQKRASELADFILKLTRDQAGDVGMLADSPEGSQALQTYGVSPDTAHQAFSAQPTEQRKAMLSGLPEDASLEDYERADIRAGNTTPGAIGTLATAQGKLGLSDEKSRRDQWTKWLTLGEKSDLDPVKFASAQARILDWPDEWIQRAQAEPAMGVSPIVDARRKLYEAKTEESGARATEIKTGKLPLEQAQTGVVAKDAETRRMNAESGQTRAGNVGTKGGNPMADYSRAIAVQTAANKQLDQANLFNDPVSIKKATDNVLAAAQGVQIALDRLKGSTAAPPATTTAPPPPPATTTPPTTPPAAAATTTQATPHYTTQADFVKAFKKKMNRLPTPGETQNAIKRGWLVIGAGS